MNAIDICSSSATTLATQIRTGALTSEAVLTAYLEQGRRAQQRFAPFIDWSATALEEARAADQSLRQGQPPGPLHGVPFTVKDWLDVKGFASGTSLGPAFGRTPNRDATVIARLRSAGGIVLGKTRAAGPADTQPGPFNPHAVAHTCGASSSGEAAAIAALASPLGVGSDSGGSIRWPAHCCGVAGLKPTQGRVPLTGHVPPIIALTDPRTVIGPLARTVADLALALSIMHGPDGQDASTLPVPLDVSRVVPLKSLKVAMFTQFADTEPSIDIVNTLHQAAARLRERGATVTSDIPDFIEEAFPITRNYWQRPESVSWSRWAPSAEPTLPLASVEEALFKWDRLRRSFLAFMNRYDLILCPVAAEPAPPERAARATDFMYTLPFSLSGQPVVTVCAGTTSSGLPIGVQIVGRAFAEPTAFAAATAIEQT